MAGTAAPLNPGYKEHEVGFFLEDTDARVLILPTTRTVYVCTKMLDDKREAARRVERGVNPSPAAAVDRAAAVSTWETVR